MSNETGKFTVWYNADGAGGTNRQIGSVYDEPAEAVDIAETWLAHGKPGKSFAEIKFNGDIEAHTLIFRLEDKPEYGGKPAYGVFNTPSAMWPVYYPEQDAPYGVVLENPLSAYRGPGGTPSDAKDDGKGKSEVSEDAPKLDLGAEEDDEPESDDGDDGEDDEDDFNPDDDSEDEASEDDDAEDPEDEVDDDDFTEDEDGEDEADTETDGEGDEEDDDDADGDDGDAESDSEDDDEQDEDENETEKEPPVRLKIFGKMRGPKGWRKRAEAEELMERNVFALKVGILSDDEDLSAAQREKNVAAHVEFIETNTEREAGTLRMRLPEGITLADFTQTKSGWITVTVPYNREEA